MKGNKKLLVIAALFLFVGVGVATYAIYKTTVSGTATVTAATWNVAFKNGQAPLTNNFNLVFENSDCTSAHVATGKIAPGTTCTKTITIDATGTEVDVEYTATVDNTNITAATGDIASANTFTASLTGDTGVIAVTDNDKVKTITVTIAWAGEDTATKNAGDISVSGANITVPVTLVAKQYLGNN